MPQILNSLDPKSTLVESAWLSYTVMFLAVLLLAPFFFLVYITPDLKERFISGFVEGVDKD
jgi:hypothetical protein